MNANEVMAEEVAREEIARWQDQFSTELEEISPKLLRAVKQGRINLEGSVFKVKLLAPLQLENGQVIGSLEIREPTAAIVRQSGKGGSEADLTMRVLSAVTGQPLGVLDRLGSRDLAVIGELMSFFA